MIDPQRSSAVTCPLERRISARYVVGADGAHSKVRELLGIPEPYAIACVIPLGKPAHQPRKLSRREVAELTRLEHWQGEPRSPPADG